MQKKILVLKGQSQYNVLSLAADYMIDAFNQKGYLTTEFDLTKSNDVINNLLSILDKDYVLIFSFQALLCNIRLLDGSFFLNALNVPVFGHIVDHPIYHDIIISPLQGDNIFLGFIDKNHVNYVKKYYPHIKHKTFMPHGGFNTENIIPYENRDIDFYFPASYTNPNKLAKEIKNLPDVYKNMAHLFIEQMLSSPLLTLQDALSTYLNSINFTYSTVDFTELMNLFSLVDKYIRNYQRDNCIRTFLENHIKVTVSGTGWDTFDCYSKHNLIILNPNGIDILDVIKIISNAKLTFNHIPTLQNGLHERIFTSMMCGCICVTNDFPIIHKEFTDGEDVLLCNSNEPQGFADKVKSILDSPVLGTNIAYNGSVIANASHSWLKNAENILKTVGLDS